MTNVTRYFEGLEDRDAIGYVEFALSILATSYENVPTTEPAKETGSEFVLRTLDLVEKHFSVDWEAQLNEGSPYETFGKGFYNRALAIAWLCCQSAAFENKGDREGAWDYATRATYHAATMQAGVQWACHFMAAPTTAIRELTKKANDARHQRNRETSALIEEFYLTNHQKFSSLDAAAESAIKIFPVSFRTARKHIGAAKKLRSTRKE